MHECLEIFICANNEVTVFSSFTNAQQYGILRSFMSNQLFPACNSLMRQEKFL